MNSTNNLGIIAHQIEEGISNPDIQVIIKQRFIRINFRPRQSIYVEPQNSGIMLRVVDSNIERYINYILPVLSRKPDNGNDDGQQIQKTWYAVDLDEIIQIVNSISSDKYIHSNTNSSLEIDIEKIIAYFGL